MVVDRDVQVLPAGAAGAVDSVLADALADLAEAAELLAVDVQQLAWTLALVAYPRVALGARQPRATRTAQHLADRRGGPLEDRRDHRGPAPSSRRQYEDLRLLLAAQPPWLPRGVEGRSTQALPAARPGSGARADSPSRDSRRRAAAASRALATAQSTGRSATRLKRDNASAWPGIPIMHPGLLASWVLVDHKARRRPGRNQPSRRCVVSPARARLALAACAGRRASGARRRTRRARRRGSRRRGT